jgi:hypothetical protein
VNRWKVVQASARLAEGIENERPALAKQLRRAGLSV